MVEEVVAIIRFKVITLVVAVVLLDMVGMVDMVDGIVVDRYMRDII